MPKSKAPKKKYRLDKMRRVLPITIRFNSDAEHKLKMIPHQCLLNFKTGSQTEGDWHTLAARVNLGARLDQKHFGQAKTTMAQALDALHSSWERFERLSQMGMTGEEYNAVALALPLIDEMELNCTRREIDLALCEVLDAAAIFNPGKGSLHFANLGVL